MNKENIRNERINKKMTMGEISKLLNIRVSQYSNFEHGRESIPLEIIDKLKDILEIGEENE